MVGEKLVTGLVYLTAIAIIIRNGDKTSRVIQAISQGANGVISTLTAV